MASAQVVETSVNTNNSPSQDYTTNPDDHSNHNSFDIKIISRKTFWRPLKPTSNSGEIFVFQNLVLYMRYHNTFFVDLKLYLWSIHMASNLILAISFGFKLNSNLN